MVLEKSSLFIILNVKNTASFKFKIIFNVRPTETYYIPNCWKFYEDFAELFRFEIAALCKGENPILLCPLFMHIPHYIMVKKSGLNSTTLFALMKAAISILLSSAKSSLNFYQFGI